jgi:hypothetical protein
LGVARSSDLTPNIRVLSQQYQYRDKRNFWVISDLPPKCVYQSAIPQQRHDPSGLRRSLENRSANVCQMTEAKTIKGSAKLFEYNMETRKGRQRRKTVERKGCPDYAAWIGIAQ